MWNNNKTYKLSYLGWSCVLHTAAMLLVIFNPYVEDVKEEKIEITFQVAGQGVNVGSKKGDSLDAKKAKTAPTKNEFNDSLLSELEKEVSKGTNQHQEEKILAAKATNTQAPSEESSSLESEFNKEAVAPAKPATVDNLALKNLTEELPAEELPVENLAENDLAEELNNNPVVTKTVEENTATSKVEENTANLEESGLRNLVKKSDVAVPRQQVLGKRKFKANRLSTLGEKRNSLNRDSALGKARSALSRKSVFEKRKTNANRNSSLGEKRTSLKRTSGFAKKRTSKANRKSALSAKRNSYNTNRNNVFGKRDSKARAATIFARNTKTGTRPAGALGKRNQSGTRAGSAFGRSKGNSNKTRTASALGKPQGKGKRSYGNAFGRGGAGSGKTFGLPKGVRDARSLKQIAGNPVPSYPYYARRHNHQGVVFLVYYVDTFGKVSKVKIHRSSGFANLDQSAKKTITRYRYYKGQSGYVIHPVEFTLNGTVKVNTNSDSRI